MGVRTMPLLHPHIPAGEFDLNELLEFEPPTRWHPEEGEKVQGQLVKLEERTTWGRSAPTLFILVPPNLEDIHEHKYVVVRASGVVLRGALEDLDPLPGETVAIKYEGKKPTSDGTREYAMYRFAVRRDRQWLVAR